MVSSTDSGQECGRLLSLPGSRVPIGLLGWMACCIRAKGEGVLVMVETQ